MASCFSSFSEFRFRRDLRARTLCSWVEWQLCHLEFSVAFSGGNSEIIIISSVLVKMQLIFINRVWHDSFVPRPTCTLEYDRL